MTDAPRSVRINVRVLDSERDELDRRADAAGMDRSEYVRHRLGLSNGPDPVDVVRLTTDGVGWPVWKFRVQPELPQLVEDALAVSDVGSLAVFCREAIEAAARRQLATAAAAARYVPPVVQVAQPLRVLPDGCLHPPTAHRRPASAMSPFCGLCGTVLDRRI